MQCQKQMFNLIVAIKISSFFMMSIQNFKILKQILNK